MADIVAIAEHGSEFRADLAQDCHPQHNGTQQSTHAADVANISSEPHMANGHERQTQVTVNGCVDSSALLSHLKGAEWPEEVPTLWSLFVRSAICYPDALAIASISQQGELYNLKNAPINHDAYRLQPYVRWTYAEFVKAVTRAIGALCQCEVREGFPILTFLHNIAEYPIIFWAAVALGCTVIPIHPRSLLNREESLHILTKAMSISPTKDAIVFVQDDKMAQQILDLGVLRNTNVVALDATRNPVYRSFEDFMTVGQTAEASELAAYEGSAKSWKLILFTSGTTALPKGIVLDSFRLDRWMVGRRGTIPLVPGDSVLLNLPNNHIFYYLNILTFPCCGGGMVLSGSSFSPQSFPKIMEIEQCGYLPMPPTLIHAIVEVCLDQNVKFESLKCITTGGSKLSVESLRSCFDVLGTRGVEVIYGSTETNIAVTSGIISDLSELIRDGDASVGWVGRGAEIKICAHDGTSPVPRNTEGELHFGSRIRTDGYVGEETSDNFYTDGDGQKWFATGDVAVMNDEGMIFIVGRIKDMIIRGATNISPAAVEFVLSQDLRAKNFNVQVIAKLDAIAGEVPIAISQKSVTSEDVKHIREIVLQHMGPAFLPEEVITLDDLGLVDFPRTTLGKIQKAKLTTTVREYIRMRDNPGTNGRVQFDELTSKVQKIWKRTIGHGVDTQARVSDFADSITIMRVRDRFSKDLGAKLSLAEILSAQTVEEQIDLVRAASEKPKLKKDAPQETDILTVHNIVHLAGMPDWFASTKAYISHKISKVGLAWEDIQAIVPASDFTQVLTQADILNYSWSWKYALLSKPGIDKTVLRKGIEIMLVNNPLLSSFFFHERTAFGSDVALHVIPKTNEKLFKTIFRDYGSISNKEDFAKLVYEPYEYEMATLPGPLVQFLLFDIQATGQSGVVMVSHHVTNDASYVQLVFDDLDRALGGSTTLEQHTSYKIWADSYFALRTSLEARLASKWHVNRLQGLTSWRESVFPPLPRPHHFTNSHVHVQDVSDNGYHSHFSAQGLKNLRHKNPTLSAPTIIKAAWSLLNIHRNKTNVATFSNLQADRRRFPFVPSCLEALSPAHTFEAGNVAGPTLQDVVNIIHLHPEESMLDFLHRVTLDQEDLNTYAAAPLRTVLEELGPTNAEIMLDILRSQIFNWTPGLGALFTNNPFDNFESLSMFIRPSIRLVINVDVGGLDDETVFFQIKSPLYDQEGLQSLARDFEDFVLYFCDENIWNTRSGNFRKALRAPSEANGGLR